MPLWEEWVRKRSAAYHQICGESDHMGPKPVDLYRRTGLIPIGDTATVGGGAWGWWYHTDEATEKHWKENPGRWWQRHFEGVARTARENLRVGSDPSIIITDYLKPELSGEQMIPIIAAIACNQPGQFIVNIPNSAGLVAGIPRDFAVEVPALVDARGIHGLPTGGLPEPVLGYLLRDRVAPVNLELEAYRTGKKDLLVELICMDPWTRTVQQARELVDAILNLDFNASMRAHYR